MKAKLILIAGAVVIGITVFCFSGEVGAEAVDLSKSFTCPDVSPTPMHITKGGLLMGGVLYPTVNSNASMSARITTSIFGSDDGMNEIDVRQEDNGSVTVSYMKFKVNPIDALGSPDDNKLFEKASFSLESPPIFFHSKNQGCKN